MYAIFVAVPAGLELWLAKRPWRQGSEMVCHRKWLDFEVDIVDWH